MTNSEYPQKLRHDGGMLEGQMGLLGFVMLLGAFVNTLVLTGPIFALQVYDRVIGSRSVETLIALCVIMAFLFLIMGLMDHARKRIAVRIGERIVLRLEPLVAGSDPSSIGPQIGNLETLRHFFASPLLVAVLDLIWVPLFVLALAVLHPLLALACLLVSSFFVVPALFNFFLLFKKSVDGKTKDRLAGFATASISATHGSKITEGIVNNWRRDRAGTRRLALNSQDSHAFLINISQTFRMFLQSATIALGAYLVLRNELTAGAILAATVLMARVIGPLDSISQNTHSIRRFARAFSELSKLPHGHSVPCGQTWTKTPGLSVEQITVFPPNQRQAAIRMISFQVQPGSAIGVTGPSGSGKSALANAIVGAWPIAGGALRKGGYLISGNSPSSQIDWFGYLPQNPGFLLGTIAQNISGFTCDHCNDAIQHAAMLTKVHDQILSLRDGYQTIVGPDCRPFAAGVSQRISFARAVFGGPEILILDEPATHLGGQGKSLVSDIIKEMKIQNRSAIVFAQDVDELAVCDRIFVLDRGTQKAFEQTRKPQQTSAPNDRGGLTQVVS